MSLTPTTLMIPVFAASRGYNYVAILWPPPVPGTIQVDYMAEGKWYRLRDDGTGFLAPDIPDTGTGKIDYAAGQVAITCAALPDVDTPILVRWGSPVELVQMQGVVEIAIEPVHHTLTGTPVAPGSLSITWPVGVSDTATATDDGHGNITGDATGWINYGNGEMEFTPTQVPVADSNYTINHDKYAEQTHTANGSAFALPNAPIKAGSLSMDVQLTIGGWNHAYRLRDNGSGAMSAPGFTATLSQARECLTDAKVISTAGVDWSGYRRYDSDSSTGQDIQEGSKESTITLVAGGISATVDYVTGQVVFDLSTATATKSTIDASGASSTMTSDTSIIIGRV